MGPTYYHVIKVSKLIKIKKNTDSTPPDRKYEQNRRVVVNILIAIADNATTQHGDANHGGLVTLLTRQHRLYAVIFLNK